MFATRTLARAPVAGRLAGSVSTLRVASLSAFTSGSKLAGFFGRASGQSGAPAFQQLGLRMSLCRAFSSQPPISEPTEADLLTAARNYTVENLKKDFPTLVARMEAMFQPAPEAEPRIISPDSVLALLTILHTLTFQQYLAAEIVQRPYRAQFLDTDMDKYAECVRQVTSFLVTLKDECLLPVCQDFGTEIGDLFNSLRQHMESDPKFMENYKMVMSHFPKGKEEVAPLGEKETLDALELMFTISQNFQYQGSDKMLEMYVRSIYISDKLWKEHGLVPQDIRIEPDRLSPEGKQRFQALQGTFN